MALRSRAKGSILGYTSGRQYDGDVGLRNALMRDGLVFGADLYRKDLYAHYGCVNAIEFSNDGEWLVSGGDDQRVLLWNVQEAISGPGRPQAMKGHHNSNIFCLCFDSCHKTVFSAGNDEQVVIHDVATGVTKDVFLHDEAVYGLSVQPGNDFVFASASDDGSILVYDVREPRSSDPLLLATSTSPFHAVTYNPVEPRLLATANSREGAALWDVRCPRRYLLCYDGAMSQSAMSVRFNSRGTQVLVLRRRRPPAVFQIQCRQPVVQMHHVDYCNSCTMKSCCFAGQRDEYVMSGSDDFQLYAWKLPDDIEESADLCDAKSRWVGQAHLVLQGHRSIVNQVRFNKTAMVVASSGVEKMIKLWSSLPLPGGSRCTRSERRRRRFTYQEYVHLVLESGQLSNHDYSHKPPGEPEEEPQSSQPAGESSSPTTSEHAGRPEFKRPRCGFRNQRSYRKRRRSGSSDKQ
ncbi:hypothetical protein HPB51_006680 [Rhipicephalus microplus]|uniref:DDB1- and CUL4-associated factor 5 n=1 Tax=Rhipicephalus microplus TaxID=6941 RepID=A0A9J6E834_RHIMP|nr:hypothetical protein HPB51_006680 [Rhipicephalus microplus]